jgi:endoglucanase
MIRAAYVIAGLGFLVLATSQATFSQAPNDANRSVQFTGVNIAGAEFGPKHLPGKHTEHYIYPEPSTISYFATTGMNIIRVPMLWERLQRQLGADLDREDMLRVDHVIRHAGLRGMKVIIDVHNYAAYAGAVIGTPKLPTSALGDLWGKIAARYKDNDAVVFGVMNEPKGLRTETWLEAANIAVAEIRRAGAKNLILVPGNDWSSARSWVKGNYGTPNGKAMLNIVDPADNHVYEVHQYFDYDYTGTHSDCQNVDIGITTLTPFTQWAREHGKRGFLGEFGAGSDPTCLEALDRVLRFMAQNSDVWLGWAYWAGGAWWDRNYYTNVQPVNGQDRVQMSVLKKYTRRAPPATDVRN